MDLIGSFFLSNYKINDLVLGVSWSLTYELYFYFLFFLIVQIPIRYREKAIHLITFLLLIKAFLYLKNLTPSFFLSPYLLEFFLGSSLFFISKKLKNHLLIPIFLVTGAVAAYIGVTKSAEYNETLRSLTFGVTAASLLAIFITLENTRRFVAGTKHVFIGDASYSIYLSHSILLHLLYFTGLREWMNQQAPLMTEITFFSYLAFIVYISCQFYKFVEKPLYQSGLRKTKALFCWPIRR